MTKNNNIGFAVVVVILLGVYHGFLKKDPLFLKQEQKSISKKQVEIQENARKQNEIIDIQNLQLQASVTGQLVSLKANQWAMFVEMRVMNNLEYDIRAFEGTMHFSNLFREPVCVKEITCDNSIPSKGEVLIEGTFDLSEFDFCKGLQSKSSDNVRFLFRPKRILLSLGSILESKAHVTP